MWKNAGRVAQKEYESLKALNYTEKDKDNIVLL